jgi:hypothetical protein
MVATACDLCKPSRHSAVQIHALSLFFFSIKNMLYIACHDLRCLASVELGETAETDNVLAVVIERILTIVHKCTPIHDVNVWHERMIFFSIEQG